jgi:hypothetical protein
VIHDPTFPITCDGEGCDHEEEITGNYRGAGGSRGGYYADDGHVPPPWTCLGDDVHLCEECARKRASK